MPQYVRFPSASASPNLSVGPNGSPIPPDSTLIGIDVGGILEPVSAANPVPVTIVTPTELNVNLNEVGGVAITLGQKLMAASIPVVLASDEVVPISATALPLPLGASTSANQTTQIGFETTTASNTTSILANQTNGTQVTAVNNFPAVQPISGTVTANQGTANATPWNENIAQYGGSATSLGQKTSANSIPVVFSSDQPPAPVASVFFTGQQTSTGTAVAIASSQALQNGVILQGKSLNAASVYIGPAGVTTANGFELQPGQATSVAINNLASVFVIASTSGDGICYVGS